MVIVGGGSASAAQPFQAVSGLALGDGVATSFSFDLTALPFNLDLRRVLPVKVTSSDPNTTVAINGTVVTVIFSSPIPTTGAFFQVSLWFATLP